MMKVWSRATWMLWLAVSAQAGHAANDKPPLTPEQARQQAVDTFRKAQANVRSIQDGPNLLRGAGLVQAACGELATLDQGLATLGPTDAKTVAERARLIVEKQQDCDDATSLQRRLDALRHELLDASRSVLRLVASGLDRCKGDDKNPCLAEKLSPSVDLLASILKPDASLKDLEGARTALVKSASDAQQRVSKVKQDTADVYPLGDTAIATVLKSRSSDDKMPRGESLREAAEQGMRSSVATKAAVGEAQTASNALVRHAVDLLEPCKSETAKCLENRERARVAAVAADSRLSASLAQAEQSYQLTKEAGWAAEAGKYGRMADRQRSVAFARLLDTYPDARSLVGETSAAQINTSGDGTDATIKISLAKVGLGSARQQAIILKAPLGDRDRVKTPVALGYSSYWLRALDPKKKEGEYDLLWVTGFSPKVDFATRSYRDPAHIEKSIDMRAREWTLAGYVGWYWLRNRSPDLHLLTVEVKRTYDAKAKQIRCPAPVLDTVPTCFDDVYEKPEKRYERQFKYQWRTQLPTELGSFALSPTFSYDQRTKEKRLEVTLYLWRPEGKDQPFNAGIKLDIGSKSADRVGLGVGTNFDLFGLPER